MTLLALFILVSAASSPDSQVMNSVHEWGVVVFGESGEVDCGGPWQQSVTYPEYGITQTYAPVVWIYGEPFSGTFQVDLTDGQNMGHLHPTADLVEPNSARWNISTIVTDTAANEEFYRSSTFEGPFEWAASLWRAIPSLQLRMDSFEVEENFIYYDCSVRPEFTDHFFSWNTQGQPEFESYSLDDALLFSGEGLPDQVVWRNGEFIPLGRTTPPDMALEEITKWVDSTLTKQETEALWLTWQPVFNQEGTRWLVFPIPEEFYGEISSITLFPDHGGEVEYRRFYLGAIRLSAQ